MCQGITKKKVSSSAASKNRVLVGLGGTHVGFRQYWTHYCRQQFPLLLLKHKEQNATSANYIKQHKIPRPNSNTRRIAFILYGPLRWLPAFYPFDAAYTFSQYACIVARIQKF